MDDLSPQQQVWRSIRDLHAEGRVPVPMPALVRLAERGWFGEDGLDELVCPPKHITPSPDLTVEGAWFDVPEVEKTLKQFCSLRHTKGRRHSGRPLRPLPWQVLFILAPIFGWKHSLDESVAARHDVDPGSRVIREAFIEIPRKGGKALDVDTPLLTERGWSTMGDVAVGDRVHTVDGSLTEVVAKSDVHVDPVGTFEVEFADGQVFVAGGDHEWVVKDRLIDPRRGRARVKFPARQWRTVTTVELAESFDITNPSKVATVDGVDYSCREFRYSVSTDRTLDRPNVDLPLDPYLMGVWLGDGDSSSGRVTSGDPEVFDELVRRGYRLSGNHVRNQPEHAPSRTVYGIAPTLRRLGVLGNKHVPDEFLLASEPQRLDLLRGLVDTDGTVSKRGHVEFYSTNRRLADGALFLARSLGFKATISEGVATLYGREIGPKWRVKFVADQNRRPVLIPRKAARLKSERASRSTTNKIVRVERVADRPVQCIQVADPSCQYLAGVGLTPTHNSTICSAVALKLLAGDGEPGAEVYAAAKDTAQAKLVFEPAKVMGQRSPGLAATLEFRAGVIRHPRSVSFFRALSSIADAAHGLNPSGGIVDEIHVHKSRELYDVIQTGAGARSQPLIVSITTADDNAQGTLYDDLHTGVVKLEAGTVDPEPATYGVIFAADEEADPFDEATWWSCNPSLPHTPTVGYLRDQAKKAKNRPSFFPAFTRLHLNQRSKGGAGMFDMELWAQNALPPVDVSSLKGRECFGGIVLTSSIDLNVVAWVFPGRLLGLDGELHDGYEVVARAFLPEGALDRETGRRSDHEGMMRRWAADGWLTLTDGDAIDYRAIEEQVRKDLRTFKPVEAAYLRYQAEQFRQTLVELRPPRWKDDPEWVFPLSSSMDRLAAPTEELFRALELGVFQTGGNPVLRWMAANSASKIDAEKRMKVDPKESKDAVPGITAITLAIAAAIRERKQEPDAGFAMM